MAFRLCGEDNRTDPTDRTRRAMSVSDEFLEFLLDQLSGWGGVTARKMFGGAGLYRDGKMFGLIE